jgi:serine/threonine protein kinase
MGEVYQAHDTKLGRDVAIKVLPEGFAHDAERLARFQREAKMLAALNHPNIATIHGLEQSNGTSYLVMELVSGDTLADRIKRDGSVPIEEALAIAKQIAEALEAAHEKGIIHRDLKPANVKLHRCLEKDAQRRLRDIGEARVELLDALAGTARQEVSWEKRFKMTRHAAVGALAGAAASAVGAATSVWYLWPRAPKPVMRLNMDLTDCGPFPGGESRRIHRQP